MDLKLENLLLDHDLKLKIADFDLSCQTNQTIRYERGRGTANYRAPEVKSKSCYSPKAADVYSAGIILFTFISGGFPGVEDTAVEGFNLYDLMLKNDPNFWTAHSTIHKTEMFSKDFKELFFKMVHSSPE